MREGLSRRRLLARTAAAAPAAALPLAAAAGPVHPDAGLLRLGAAMEAAAARERAVWATIGTVDDGTYEAAAGRAADETFAVIRRIERVPARTVDGLRVKALALAWCRCGEPLEPDAGETADVRLAYAIARDLLATGRA